MIIKLQTDRLPRAAHYWRLLPQALPMPLTIQWRTTMSSSSNAQPNDELDRRLDTNTTDLAIVSSVVQGLTEVRKGQFAKESILDILRED
jgi:hypothetical protein